MVKNFGLRRSSSWNYGRRSRLPPLCELAKRQGTRKELEPFLSDEQEQTKQMSALGKVDLNCSRPKFATAAMLPGCGISRLGRFRCAGRSWPHVFCSYGSG